MSTQNKRTTKKKNIFDMKANETTMTVHKISEDIETPAELFINSDLLKPRFPATANTTGVEMGI